MNRDTPLGRFASQFAESRLALAGLALLAVVLLVAILAPWIAPQNPYDLAKLDLLDARLPPGSKAGPGLTVSMYALGTDGQGRDMLSAILYGLRVSLTVGVTSAMITLSVPLPSTAIRISATRIAGKPSWMSTTRISSCSKRPPAYAASTPARAPIVSAITPLVTPTVSETRSP